MIDFYNFIIELSDAVPLIPIIFVFCIVVLLVNIGAWFRRDK